MSEDTTPSVICANPDCKIAVDGKCVEGMEREKCPHFGHPLKTSEVTQASEAAGIRLPAGILLKESEATALVRRRASIIIAMLAPSEAGKTSLIASLFDLFQESPIGNVEFRGSKTLRDFELVCHDARAASRRNKPHTERTKRGEVKFFHLDVSPHGDDQALTLILADRAGEEYRSAIDNPTNADGFLELRRCDVLALLIDGDRLLAAETRHDVKSDARLLIQAMVEQQIFERQPRLAIVLTKLDLLDGAQHGDRARSDFNTIVASITELFGNAFSEIETHFVAASPKVGGVSRGTGIAKLLNQWLKAPKKPSSEATSSLPASRAFARLQKYGELFEHG